MGGGRVFLHVWPTDANDLPVARRPFGFDALVDFQRSLPGWRKDGKCYAVCRLPDYGIASMRTGSVAGEGVAWEGGFSLGPAGGEASGSAAAADESRRPPSPGADAGA